MTAVSVGLHCGAASIVGRARCKFVRTESSLVGILVAAVAITADRGKVTVVT